MLSRRLDSSGNWDRIPCSTADEISLARVIVGCISDVRDCMLRGLIHHAVLGELLAKAILAQDIEILPKITRKLGYMGGEEQVPFVVNVHSGF